MGIDPVLALSSASVLPMSATHRFANRSGEYHSPPSTKITAPVTRTATLLTMGRVMRISKEREGCRSERTLSRWSTTFIDRARVQRALAFPPTICSVSPIRYAGGHLDRAARLRQDDDWVSAAFVSDAAAAVLILKDQNLVAGLRGGEDAPRAAVVPLAVVRERIPSEALTWAFLGLDG